MGKYRIEAMGERTIIVSTRGEALKHINELLKHKFYSGISVYNES